jgi:hypothetical protein
MGGEEFYGNQENAAAMKRGAALWSFLKADSRFAYYGRFVALSQPVENKTEVLLSLARLQGVGLCYFFPKSEMAAIYSEFESSGLAVDRHEHFLGAETAYTSAKAVLSAYNLPTDLAVRQLDETTPANFIAEVVDLMESCEVMPVPASILRGKQRNGICLVAIDGNGGPVGVASSFFMHPAEGPHAKTVFWGMLSTRPDRRGQKIALVLGAQAIVQMWEEKGARAFMTGVRHDNVSSTALCNRLGVTDSDYAFAVCIDVQTLGRKKSTK